jgi:hypothetical protein
MPRWLAGDVSHVVSKAGTGVVQLGRAISRDAWERVRARSSRDMTAWVAIVPSGFEIGLAALA